jgi:hypothetical protein
VHDLQVRNDGVVHVLPEQRGVVEAVEADAVGDLDEVELFLFGQDFIDVRFEEGVCFEDFGADAALDARLDFGFRAGRESLLVFVRIWGVLCGGLVRTDSFLNMVGSRSKF